MFRGFLYAPDAHSLLVEEELKIIGNTTPGLDFIVYAGKNSGVTPRAGRVAGGPAADWSFAR